MRVLVIDTSYLIYRSYFAYPKLTFQDIPTGAFFGFVKAILGFIQEFKPEQIFFATDTPKPTWRHDILDSYKGTRSPAEQAMISQIPMINQWIQNITKNYLAQDGFEADDYVKTVCTEFLEKNLAEVDEVLIFSADRDLYQLLVYPKVKFIQIKSPKDGYTLFGHEEFVEKYELDPIQWLDYKTLVGDSSDNLAGMSGIGPKTATKILLQIGCLYNLVQVLSIENSDFATNIFHNTKYLINTKEFVENPKNQGFIEKFKETLPLLNQTHFLSSLQNVPDTKLSLRGFDLQGGLAEVEKYGFKSLVSSIKSLAPVMPDSDGLF